MNALFLKHTLCSAAAISAVLAFNSCQSDELEPEQNKTQKNELYNKSFTTTFGNIDKEQDWTMVRQVSTKVSTTAQGELNVSILTASPMQNDARLLYQSSFSGGEAEFKFDLLKARQSVFVLITDSEGNKLTNGYFDVKDNALNVGTSRAALTRAGGSCPVTIGDKIEPKVITSADWTTLAVPNIYYLDGVDLTQKTDVMELGNLAQFLRSYTDKNGETKPGVYMEGTNHIPLLESGEVEPNVSYVMESAGPITLSLVYKGTDERHNHLGYFYYPSNMPLTAENFKNLNKYIVCTNITGSPTDEGKLIEISTHGQKWDASLGTNVPDYSSYTDWTKVSGMQLPQMISSEWNDKYRLRGTKIQLTYFGEDGKGTPTYTFPQGCKIGFFILKYNPENGDNTSFNKVYTSDADLNKELTNEIPTAATFRYNGYTVLGFEDQPYGDKDINDVLFLAEGNFKKNIVPDLTPGGGSSSSGNQTGTDIIYEDYIIAFEDLGSIGDFDFNDVVLSVTPRKADGTIDVKMLAAGGTLETNVLYGDQVLNFTSATGGVANEVHDAFGVDLSTMVNTGLVRKDFVPTATIAVDKDFTLANPEYASKFRISVHNKNKTITLVSIPTTPGESPQAILIGDNNWEWPAERQNINEKYPSFKQWVNDNLDTNWYDEVWFKGNNIIENEVIVRESTTLTVNIDNVKLILGGNAAHFTATATSGANVTASVSGNSANVVRIDNNAKTITPIGVGTAEIVFHAPETERNTEAYYALYVTVSAQEEPQPEVVLVNSVTLNKTSATLTVGDDLQLTATVNPSNATNKNLNWASSNTNVATVDASGNVKAVAAGNATITATAADGSGKYASCAVNVNAAPAAGETTLTLTQLQSMNFEIPASYFTSGTQVDVTYYLTSDSWSQLGQVGEWFSLTAANSERTIYSFSFTADSNPSLQALKEKGFIIQTRDLIQKVVIKNY